jgi:hypothetical protein
MADARFIVSGLTLELQTAAAHARAVTLVSPFITSGGIQVVLGALPENCSLTVVTRWRASEVAAGVSDPGILASVVERRGRVLLNDGLHAKLYLFDEDVAFVGSANLTERGFAVYGTGNVEALVSLAPPPTSLFRFVRRLALESVEATDADAIMMLAAAKTLPPRHPFNDVRVERVQGPAVGPFPQLRSPERLFDLYLTLTSALTREERAQAIDDLNALAIPDGLGDSEFAQAVKANLRRHPLVVALDSFLETRRRFGEVTEWLKTTRSYPSHRSCQRHAQTLIRWLTYYLPETYRVGQPHYAEVLERVEA